MFEAIYPAKTLARNNGGICGVEGEAISPSIISRDMFLEQSDERIGARPTTRSHVVVPQIILQMFHIGGESNGKRNSTLKKMEHKLTEIFKKRPRKQK